MNIEKLTICGKILSLTIFCGRKSVIEDKFSSNETLNARSGFENKRTITGVTLELYSSCDSLLPIFTMAPSTFGPPPPNSTDLRSSGSTFILKKSSGKSSESSSSWLHRLVSWPPNPNGNRNELDKLFSFSVVLQAEALNVICQSNQWGMKEAAGSFALFYEIPRTQP